MTYDWTLDLDVTDADAPPKAAPRTPGQGKAQLQLPQSVLDRLQYVGEDDWFAVKDIPSATAANAFIYKVRQTVKGNGNGLNIKVDSPDNATVASLLKTAKAEREGSTDTPVSLRFHVKQEGRKGVGRPTGSTSTAPAPVQAVEDTDVAESQEDLADLFQ